MTSGDGPRRADAGPRQALQCLLRQRAYRVILLEADDSHAESDSLAAFNSIFLENNMNTRFGTSSIARASGSHHIPPYNTSKTTAFLRTAISATLLACLALARTQVAHATAWCSETVTELIVSGDTVYFTTNESCPNWCEISTSWDTTATNRAFSLLTSARVASLPIEFEWGQLSACGSAVPTYSSPASLLL
jgi:hypothetical protein